MPHAKHQTPHRTRTTRLRELYKQLQAVMPLLQEIVQPASVKPEPRLGERRPADVREAAPTYTPAATLSPEAGPRYRFEKQGREAWAVLDTRKGDALLALTKYKRGTETLIERLEAYERCIAQSAPMRRSACHQAAHIVFPLLQLS
jgi:hypothetical protein